MITCQDGFQYKPTTGLCEPCPPGTFSLQNECELVPTGYFNPVSGIGSINFLSCQASIYPGAAYCDSGSENCGPGKYLDNEKRCALVPQGYYQHEYGGAVYYRCEYSLLPGAAYCLTGTGAIPVCSAADHDSGKEEGMGSLCSAAVCHEGEYFDGLQAACISVPPGYYSPTHGSIAGAYYVCPDGLISSAGATHCTKDASGTKEERSSYVSSLQSASLHKKFQRSIELYCMQFGAAISAGVARVMGILTANSSRQSGKQFSVDRENEFLVGIVVGAVVGFVTVVGGMWLLLDSSEGKKYVAKMTASPSSPGRGRGAVVGRARFGNKPMIIHTQTGLRAGDVESTITPSSTGSPGSPSMGWVFS